MTDLDPETYEHLHVTRTDGIGRITLDRPEEQNTLTEPMAGDLRDATVALDADDEIRCLVLEGTDGWFCAGADLSQLAGDETDGRRLRALASRLHTAVRHLARTPKPAITAVDGIAAGGGFGLALSGDLVVLSESARFEFAYPRIGLSADGGATYFLPELVGQRRAREIALLDEPIGAEEAVEMGLATEVVADDEFDDRIDELATNLASGPTRAYGAVKRLLSESHDRSLEEHLEAETDSVARMAGTEDYARGHEAFFSDEEPSFQGN